MNELPKLIEWAFLCKDVEALNDGGWNIINLNNRFDLTIPLQLFIVFRITQSPFSEFRLGIFIGTKSEKDIETHSHDFPIESEILIYPIGKKLHEPGNYTVEIRVDGELQHSLDLFLR